MAVLADRDVRQLVAFLYEAGAVEGSESFSDSVRDALWRLISCDVFNHFVPTASGCPEWLWEVGEPVAPFTPEIAEALRVYFPQCPIQVDLAFLNRPTRMSDVAPSWTQHRREAWCYVERPLGIKDSIRLCLGTPEGIIGGFDFLDMGRGGVGDRELLLLELLTPYLLGFCRRAAVRRTVRLRPDGLTPREFEILALVAEGRTNAELARLLWISPNTVRTHLENAFEKLGVHTRAAAVARVFAPPG